MTESTLSLLALFNKIAEEVDNKRLKRDKIEEIFKAILSGEFMGTELLLVSHLTATGDEKRRTVRDALAAGKVVVGEGLAGKDLLEDHVPDHITEFADNTAGIIVGPSNVRIAEIAARIIEIGAMVCSMGDAVQYLLSAKIEVGKWVNIPIVGCEVASMVSVTRRTDGQLFINLISDEEGKTYDPSCVFAYKVMKA